MYPDTIPIITEIIIVKIDAAKPTITEIRAPKITRLSMSRPRLSVPNQYWADGVARRAAVVSFIP
ncbi:hypothetical protein ES705_37414 [subsurface metagenome]